MKLFSSSRSSIVSLFAVISFLLIIPLITLLASERQDIRERAAEPPIVITPPLQTIKAITGYVYLDTNQNGEREPQEKALPNIPIKITQLNNQGTTKEKSEVAHVVSEMQTDTNGYFKYALPSMPQQAISYVVTLVITDNYKTVNTNPVVLTGELTKEKQVIEFGLFPIEAPSPTGITSSVSTKSAPL